MLEKDEQTYDFITEKVQTFTLYYISTLSDFDNL